MKRPIVGGVAAPLLVGICAIIVLQIGESFHDTPAGHLFNVKERDFTHGCIRVERPLDLAAYLLRGTPDGSRDRIQALIDSGERKAIRLPEPMPAHILYWTAWVDDDGAVQFRDDIYGHDQRLFDAIRSGTEAEFQVNVPGENEEDDQ